MLKKWNSSGISTRRRVLLVPMSCGYSEEIAIRRVLLVTTAGMSVMNFKVSGLAAFESVEGELLTRSACRISVVLLRLPDNDEKRKKRRDFSSCRPVL